MTRLFALLACLPLAVLAAPSVFLRSHQSLPQDTYKVAFDEDNNRLIAFDLLGNDLGHFPVNAVHAAQYERRAAGTCTAMSKDDLKSVKGIQVLRDEAKKNWGGGWDRETVNDPDFPDWPANVCTDDSGTQIIYNNDADRSCRTTENKATGTLENGQIVIETQEGINVQATTEVTRSSSFSVGRKFSSEFNFPGIAKVTQEISFTGEWSNSQSESNTVGQDTRTRTRITQPVDAGQECTVTLTTETCDITGKASLRMTATGLVWYNYGKKKDGHYKWGLSLDALLPNVEDRSSTVEFKTSGTIDSSSHFSAKGCVKDA